MSGFNYTFDAMQYQPSQSAGAHPIGKFPAAISNTSISPTKDGGGGMFVVEFQSAVGRISKRYNLWNQSQRAVDIAHGELAALCHAIGIFRIDMNGEQPGAAIRGARCIIEVAQQANSEYVEVREIADVNGNVPGKPAAQAQQGQAAPQPNAAQFQAHPQPQPQPSPAPNWTQGQPQTQQPAPNPTQAQPQPNFQPAPSQPQANAPAWAQQAQPQPSPAPQNNAPSWAR